MSIFLKSIIGVLTGLLTYLTPKLKQWIDSIISDKAFNKVDVAIDAAIQSKKYIIIKFLSDKVLTQEEIDKFITITKAEITEQITPGIRSILKKYIDIDKYIENHLTSYVYEIALKKGAKIDEKD